MPHLVAPVGFNKRAPLVDAQSSGHPVRPFLDFLVLVLRQRLALILQVALDLEGPDLTNLSPDSLALAKAN